MSLTFLLSRRTAVCFAQAYICFYPMLAKSQESDVALNRECSGMNFVVHKTLGVCPSSAMVIAYDATSKPLDDKINDLLKSICSHSVGSVYINGQFSDTERELLSNATNAFNQYNSAFSVSSLKCSIPDAKAAGYWSIRKLEEIMEIMSKHDLSMKLVLMYDKILSQGFYNLPGSSAEQKIINTVKTEENNIISNNSGDVPTYTPGQLTNIYNTYMNTYNINPSGFDEGTCQSYVECQNNVVVQ